ncbi:MAG: hypothetical protein LBT05_00825 [Planctomycetaceae bacterium]|nr:hypothetical protein [Planctomycetaceae bacterium]
MSLDEAAFLGLYHRTLWNHTVASHSYRWLLACYWTVCQTSRREILLKYFAISALETELKNSVAVVIFYNIR